MSQAEEEPEWRQKNSCIFYKLMVDSIIQDKKLRMPSKFTRKYGGQLSKIAILTSSDGHVWIVELEKLNNNICFSSGWDKFLEYYLIQAGYFLVFKYEGKSKFRVHIFNLAVCEVQSPHNALSDSKKLIPGQNVQEADNDNQKKVLCSCPGCPASELYRKEDKPQQNAPSEEISSFKNSVRAKPECHGGVNGTQLCSSELSVPPVTSGRGSKRMKLISELGSEERRESADVPLEPWRVEDRPNRLSRKERHVMPEQQSKTLEVVSLIKPENPKKPCNKPQQNSLAEEISSLQYSVKTKPECHGNVNVTQSCSSESSMPPVTSGQGTKRMRLISELGSEDRREPADVQSEPQRVEDRLNRLCRKERVVTPEQEAKTLEVASLFKPENPKNPCCTMVLRATYVYNGYLLFPRWFARMYLEGVSGFITLICGENQWQVRCVGIDGTARLSTGWPAFVEENNILDGDVCVLDVTDTKKIIIKVTIFRVREVAGPVDNASTMS